MAKENPLSWWFLSFFAVGVAQHPMLVGISLPAYTIHTHNYSWNLVDTIAVVVCSIGLITAYVADTQLHKYMKKNQELVKAGRKKVLILDRGLWHYSRHPNYFGETLWWFGFGLFAVGLGEWYMLGGWLFNTFVLITVTFMTEDRMVTKWDDARVVLYKEYKRTTSAWLPLPKYA